MSFLYETKKDKEKHIVLGVDFAKGKDSHVVHKYFMKGFRPSIWQRIVSFYKDNF